ncbi:MAG: heme-binding protein [Gemmataceae bacterium]
MIRRVTFWSISFVCLVSVGAQAAETNNYVQLGTMLQKAAQAEPEEMAKTIQEVAKSLGDESYLAHQLRTGLKEYEQNNSTEVLKELRTRVRQIGTDLTFRPVTEAKLPKGFPGYVPAGEVRIQKYPAYRMAQAGGNEFFRLFNHIKKNNIAMTAPVEMEVTPKGENLRRETMAFLYGNPEMGKAGPQGGVMVKDIKPMMAVSTGVRGKSSNSQAVLAAQQRLVAWMKLHPEYEKVGGLRVMGWNSPFVPANRSYFEVQYKVRKKNTSSTDR